MTKVQVISIVTIDGYLQEKDNEQSVWMENDRNGLLFYRKSADYILPEYASLFSLIHEKEIAKTSYTYLAEALSEPQLPLIRRLFTYRLVDEVILYILPSIAKKAFTYMHLRFLFPIGH